MQDIKPKKAGKLGFLISDIKKFKEEISFYVLKRLHFSFNRFETHKGTFVALLYRQRGKYAKRFIHTGMAGLTFTGILIAPVIANEFPGRNVNPWEIASPSSIVLASTQDSTLTTDVSEKIRDRIEEYKVQEGDTVSNIAEKFGVSIETILWQNNLTKNAKIKPGDTIQVIPVTGISHKVQKGDTVYSIAKKYDTSPQGMVDFPFNTFSNDETFELAIGQTIIVPGGIKPADQPSAPRIQNITPNAGTVVASGSFVWPTNGTISQNFAWYHKGVDIANRASPEVLAADSGTVSYSGCLAYGYGCHVIINHNNGSKTLYGHLQKLYVEVGQGVARGNAIGRMGSTGRSTGTHLHFEVIQNGVYLNPLSVLR